MSDRWEKGPQGRKARKPRKRPEPRVPAPSKIYSGSQNVIEKPSDKPRTKIGQKRALSSSQNFLSESDALLPDAKRKCLEGIANAEDLQERVKGKRLPNGKKNRHRNYSLKTLESNDKQSPLKKTNSPIVKAVVDSIEPRQDKPRANKLEDSPSTDPRTPRTMFMGNVPIGTKAKAIKCLASAHGNVESVRFRGVVPEGPGIPKRAAYLSGRLHRSVDTLTAYIVFADPGGEEAVGKACSALNMAVLKGNHLRVTPAAQKVSCPRSSLFVGNLPFDISEEAFLNAFQTVMEGSDSKIVGARVVRDRETGIGRGFGFVTFDDHLGVRFCMSQNDKILVAGRPVRLDTADKGKLGSSKTSKSNRENGKGAKFYKKRRT